MHNFILMADSAYFVGEWKVEPSLLQISKKGKVKKLEPQLMQVLQLLAKTPGQVVSKDKLNETVWKEVVITENVITRSISSLRKAFEDDPSSPLYIETISKKGYRLIAQVSLETSNKGHQTITIRLNAKSLIVSTIVIFFVAIGSFAIRDVFLPSSSNNAYHPRAISNATTTEYWPAISPDGRFVAYGWKGRSNDNWDIYARLIGTETVLRITENPATELRAKWSNDGNYIYYLRYENGGSTIYKKPVVGGKEIRVMDSPDYSFGDFDISPNEEWLVFNTRKDRESPLSILNVSLLTGKETEITAPQNIYNGDIHPRFSPTGDRIAFIREKNSVSMFLYVYNVLTEKIQQVSFESISINGFDWSQDGNSLIYSSDISGVYKIYELNLEDGSSIAIKSGDYQMVMPRVASTGRIVYAKLRDNVNIWSYDLNNQIAQTWFATNELNLNSVPSNDGTKVCFTKQKDGNFEVWVSLPDGSEAIPITQFKGQYVTCPRWSFDDKSIIFQGFINGQSDLFQVDAKGGILKNLTQSSYDEHTPFPTKEKLYYASNADGKWEIWKMNIDGSKRTKISNKEGYAPQSNSDNSKIHFVKKSTYGIWELDLKTMTESLLIQDFHPMHQGAFVTADQGIFYYNFKSKKFEYYDLLTQKVDIVYQPQRRIPRLGITLSTFPDNQLLLFSQVDENDADIMLLEEHPIQ